MTWTIDKLPITVVILTKNEEQEVPHAIASARDDYAEVAVLDSYSSDRTVEVAQQAGASVYQNEFKGYASQRNFALKMMPKLHDWVFFVDADERITPELTAELRDNFNRLVDEGFGMVYMRRKDFFMHRWIRRSSGYPTYFGRLCYAPSVRVEREINEEYHCTRPVARFQQHLHHFPFAKGISHWVERHNRYSTAEAWEKVNDKKGELRLIFSGDPALRRKGLKHVYMSLPFRPLAGFLYLYIFRAGFLDGVAGLRFAFLRAFYEFLINLKVDQLRVADRVKGGAV